MEYPDIYDIIRYNWTMCVKLELEPSYYYLTAVLYMFIFIVDLLGNGLVILSMWRAKAKWDTADVYIVNLALADLISVVTLPLWTVHAVLGYHWPFGVALCKISSYVDLVNMYTSVFCLTCLGFDHYLAMAQASPYGNLHSRENVMASLGGIWLLSGVLALPTLLFHTIVDDVIMNFQICTRDFTLMPPSKHCGTMWIVGLSLFSSALGFLLPLLVMIICCCAICSMVRRWNEDQKRQLLKIFMLAVVFAICRSPFHMLKSINSLSYLTDKSCSDLQFLLLMDLYATCLAHLKSFLNPLLYAFLDLDFRSQYFRLLGLNRAMGNDRGSVSTHREAQQHSTEV